MALLDAVYMLNWGFMDGEEPPCLDAADIDDSGLINALLDSLYLLTWAFIGGDRYPDPPPDPGTETCGSDPTDDDEDTVEIGCAVAPDCTEE